MAVAGKYFVRNCFAWVVTFHSAVDDAQLVAVVVGTAFEQVLLVVHEVANRHCLVMASLH